MPGHPRGLLGDSTPRCPPSPSFRGLHAWMSSDGGAGPRGSVPGSALLCAPGEPTGGVHAADSVLEGELESRLPCLYKADA